jgi:hypothetical protein
VYIYYGILDPQLQVPKVMPVRIDFGKREKVKVPVSKGTGCGKGVKTAEMEMEAVWMTYRDGTSVGQLPVLLRKPHLNVTAGVTKCIYMPFLRPR